MSHPSYALPDLRRRSPWIPDLSWLVATLLILKALMTQFVFVSFDTFWHIELGEWIWENRAVPQDDLGLSIGTAGVAWRDHEWLADAVLYPLWVAGGFLGLRLLIGLIPALIFGQLYRRLREGGVAPLTGFVLSMVAAYATAHHWLARPHMLAYLCLLASLWLWVRIRAGDPRAPWLLLVVHVVWVNLHASFVLQLAFAAAFVVDAAYERFRLGGPTRRLVTTAVVSLLAVPASLLNPYGWHLLATPFTIAGGVGPRIEEWRPLPVDTLSFWYMTIYVVVLGVSLVRDRARTHLFEWLLAGGTFVLALTASRHVPVFVLSTLGVFVRHVPATLGSLAAPRSVNDAMHRLETRFEGRWLWGAVWTAGLLAAVLSTAGPLRGRVWDGVDALRVPRAAAAFLEREDVHGKVFADYGWAGYLLHRLEPPLQVFIDGRSDIYGTQRFDEYTHVMKAREGWQDVLRSYAVDVVLVPTPSGLARRLREEARWALVYSDAQASVFVDRTVFPGLAGRFAGRPGSAAAVPAGA